MIRINFATNWQLRTDNWQKTLIKKNEPFIRFFFLEFLEFGVSQDFVSVFRKAKRWLTPIEYYCLHTKAKTWPKTTTRALCLRLRGLCGLVSMQNRYQFRAPSAIKVVNMVCLFDRLLVRITETSDSELPVLTQFISALMFPTNLLPRIHWAFFKMVDKGEWEFTWNNELEGRGYRRISGLAKPLADCRTEVRF